MKWGAWLSIATLAACGGPVGKPAGPDGSVAVADAGSIDDAGTDAGGTDAGVPDSGVAQALEVWQYEITRTGQSDNFANETALVGPPQFAIGEEVKDHRVVGRVALSPEGFPPESFGEVFSAKGGIFHAWTTAPAGNPFHQGEPIGLATDFIVSRRLRRTTDQAKLHMVINNVWLELIDTDPKRPEGPQCPWDAHDADQERCGQSMVSELRMTVDAFKIAPDGAQIPIHHLGAHARLYGWHGHWGFTAGTDGDSDAFVWNERRLILTPDYAEGKDPFAEAVVFVPPKDDLFPDLGGPIKLSVPLDGVDVNQDVELDVHVVARAFNRKQFESAVGSFYWDPVSVDGLQLETEGMELEYAASPLELRASPPPPTAAVTCAGGPDPAAGVLQLGAEMVRGFEGSGTVALIPVTRSGGSKGAVSALFQISDGSAHAGADYQATAMLVRFADGEEGTRLVPVTILDNAAVDGTRTAQLSLSQPGGCASLGALTTAALEIVDDDDRPPAPAFKVGGTLSGLVGTGLVLRELFSGAMLAPAADGPFAFPPQAPGVLYDVRVDTQPDGPAQACSVAHGTGTLTADVTDVAVTCAPPLPNGALDPSFGVGGKAASTIPGAPVAMARQADGKWLLVGGLALARFNADGSVDASFGANGVASIPWSGGPFDEARAVAAQPDGKIVVAGFTSVNNQDDFALSRFTAAGAPDSSFGSGGTVTLDFTGSFDQAFRVLVQPDGKIVAAGSSVAGAGIASDSDFAAARFNGDGTLDTAFGSGGKVRVNAVGKIDVAQGLALQADGKLVLAGRGAPDGGSDAKLVVMRLGADGILDGDFGTAGVFSTSFAPVGWAEATDVAVQPDGSLVACGRAQVAGIYRFAVARLTAAGALDASFGSGGLATAGFAGLGDFGKAVALQADGKILVAGQVSGFGSNPDFGVARFGAAGGLDAGFGTGGLVAVDFFGAIDGAVGVGLQDDGKIVLGGAAKNGRQVVFALARLMTPR